MVLTPPQHLLCTPDHCSSVSKLGRVGGSGKQWALHPASMPPPPSPRVCAPPPPPS